MDSYIRSMHNALKTSGQQRKTSLQLLLEVLLCYVNLACISVLQLHETSLYLALPCVKHLCTSKNAGILNDAALIEAMCYIPNSVTASAVTIPSAKGLQL